MAIQAEVYGHLNHHITWGSCLCTSADMVWGTHALEKRGTCLLLRTLSHQGRVLYFYVQASPPHQLLRLTSLKPL